MFYRKANLHNYSCSALAIKNLKVTYQYLLNSTNIQILMYKFLKVAEHRLDKFLFQKSKLLQTQFTETVIWRCPLKRLFLKRMQNPRKIPVNLSISYFYVETNMLADFRICISVPLTKKALAFYLSLFS